MESCGREYDKRSSLSSNRKRSIASSREYLDRYEGNRYKEEYRKERSSDRRTFTTDRRHPSGASAESNEIVAKKAKTTEEMEKIKMAGSVRELTPTVLKMIDEELNEVIEKVDQLPDTTSNEFEREILSTIKDGVKLKRGLKLNLVERLTKTFNPLYLKLQFNQVLPARSSLDSFLKANNCIGLKELSQAYSFSTRVQYIEDFDRMCTTQNFIIANTRLKVSPMYEFTKCPPNLKTALEDAHIDIREKQTYLDKKTKANIILKDTDQRLKTDAIKVKDRLVQSKYQDSNAKPKSILIKESNKIMSKNSTEKKMYENIKPDMHSKSMNNKFDAPVKYKTKGNIESNVKKIDESDIKSKDFKTTDFKLIDAKTTNNSPNKPQSTSTLTKIGNNLKLSNPSGSKNVKQSSENVKISIETKQENNEKSKPTIIKVGNKVMKINESSNKDDVKLHDSKSQNTPPNSKSQITEPTLTSRDSIKLSTKLNNSKDYSQTESNPTVIKVGNQCIKINEKSKTQKLHLKKPSLEGNDYDELSDIEIQALLSKSIILDECSDSETTKVLEEDNYNEELNDSEIKVLLSKSIVLDECGNNLISKESINCKDIKSIKNNKLETNTNVNKTTKKISQVKYSLRKGRDNDELNDAEIQALLSQSIVLDEFGDSKRTDTSPRKIPTVASETKQDTKKMNVAKNTDTKKLSQIDKNDLERNNELNDTEIKKILSKTIVLDERSDFDSKLSKSTIKRKNIVTDQKQDIKKAKIVKNTIIGKSSQIVRKNICDQDELDDSEIQALLLRGIILDKFSDTDKRVIKKDAKLPIIKKNMDKSLFRNTDSDELSDIEIRAMLSKSTVLDECGDVDAIRKPSVKSTLNLATQIKKTNTTKITTTGKPSPSIRKKLEGNDDDELDDNEIQTLLSESIVIDEIDDFDAKPSTQITPKNKHEIKKTNVAQMSRSQQKAFEEGNADDELDDNEIQALLSGSIVVDEC